MKLYIPMRSELHEEWLPLVHTTELEQADK